MNLTDFKFWFVVGSQFLYGSETLNRVETNSAEMAARLNTSGHLPCQVVYKHVMTTADEIMALVKEANYSDECAGIITHCHTFSPSKMWINGLVHLQKPWLQFHTQFNESIPNDAIDMDYMNLHQAAHGDREHGYIGTRLGKSRKVIVGYWEDACVHQRIGGWMRAAVGAVAGRTLKVMRFGDNMREVAVTEGDKVMAQQKLGWQVNTWPVGALVESMNGVTDDEINARLDEYRKTYDFDSGDLDAIAYQAAEEAALRRMMDAEQCAAFTNNFQDLYGMKQLPGLATQNLMAAGYGYGGEGDWKVAAMTHIMKLMSQGLDGGTSFMEDYTYDMKQGVSLGSHMLEVCPSLSAHRPRIEVHPLGIGGREPPARLVFEGKPGPAIAVSLIDMGGRLRLIVQDITCIKPYQTMPNLPVARVMWRPLPDLAAGAHCWILAGGAHHTVLSHDCDAAMMRDWARILDLEFVHIHSHTTVDDFERELLTSEMVWKHRSF